MGVRAPISGHLYGEDMAPYDTPYCCWLKTWRHMIRPTAAGWPKTLDQRGLDIFAKLQQHLATPCCGIC